MVAAIRCYQVLSQRLPSVCRYYPSCSEYTVQALERDGLVLGSWRGFGRIARCNPLFRAGYDPL
jgi:putative membrane protein insertion efficiency factor